MTENRIFTLCRMITWVVFLRMFSNFNSSLPVKRGGSLSFLTIFTFVVPELLDLIWRKIGFVRNRICLQTDGQTWWNQYTPLQLRCGGYNNCYNILVLTKYFCLYIDTKVLFLIWKNLLKFYQLFTGEERRIPFFFDDFHFCRSRVIGLDMTENRIFTLCRMITWVVFLRIF
jgi:hypothetical protein